MKIAYILGKFSVGNRPLSFHDFFSSDRGATGTEISTARVTTELAKLGNEVHLFTCFTDDKKIFHGVNLHQYEERFIVDESFDAIVSINEPNVFFGMCKKPKRIVWQYLNDFSFVQPGFDSEVDYYLGVCDTHTKHCAETSGTNIKKWSTIGLGCDPDIYKNLKIPGRVIWCSSADRGLHHLLQIWSQVKVSIPHASLRIFYHMNYDGVDQIEDNTNNHPHVIEMANRIRYIRHAIVALKNLDVEYVGSVSRDRMAKEMSAAEAYAFPCDTVAFSEGFSVSTLEAHAAKTIPIITDTDCLGEIYTDSGAIVIHDIKNNTDSFAAHLILRLNNNPKLNDQIKEKVFSFANENTWAKVAIKLENKIKELL